MSSEGVASDFLSVVGILKICFELLQVHATSGLFDCLQLFQSWAKGMQDRLRYRCATNSASLREFCLNRHDWCHV